MGGGSIATLTAWRDHFGRSVARWPGADGFASWWGRSLAAWLPTRWRRAFGLDRGRLLLRAGEAFEVRDDAAADLPRWLLLPAHAGLRRRLSLPVAARERLRDVVGYEIDRQTPFAADAVVFDARLLRGRVGSGQLDVELVVVPRATLDAQLARLDPSARTLAGVDIEDGEGEPLGVNLLPPKQRSRRRDPARGWNIALAAMAILGTGLMLLQVLHNREGTLRQLEPRVADEARAAHDVSLQRQQLVDLVDGRVYVERLRDGRPSTVEVLDELARRLPDDTWLDKLAIENGRMVLIGRSNRASSLVGLLAGARQWDSAALTGTLQPDAGSGRDRFTLTANLAKPPEAEGADAGRD
jgi:general secretion pathway protein L